MNESVKTSLDHLAFSILFVMGMIGAAQLVAIPLAALVVLAALWSFSRMAPFKRIMWPEMVDE